MSALNINKANFHSEVIESERPVLLDFWAPWCGPCRAVVPLIDEIALERDDIKVVKVNIDEEPELAREYRFMSIPTLIVMREGKVVKKASGARPKAQILEMIN